MKLTDEMLDDLIGPVCHIADLRPSKEWPDDLRSLVGYARKVKAGFGFYTKTIRTDCKQADHKQEG